MFRRLPKFEMDQPGEDPYSIPDKQNKAGIGTILLLVAAVGLIGTCFFTMMNRASAKDKQDASPSPAMSASIAPTGITTPTATQPAGTIASSGDAPATAQTIIETVMVEVTRQVEVTKIVNQSNTVIVTRQVPGPTIIETQIVNVPGPTQLIPITQIVIQTVVVTGIPATATATASQTATSSPTSTPTATLTPTPTSTATPTETETPTP